MSHPIESLMNSVLENLKKMVDANTVIGEPIHLANGVSIIPVTKLNCGFGCGGGEYNQKIASEKMPFCGGTGGGISLQPLGFISVSQTEVKYTSLDGDNAYGIADVVVETLTKVAEKLDFGKKKKKAEAEVKAEEVIKSVIDEEEE